jgi:type I restriction enzyme S subunit
MKYNEYSFKDLLSVIVDNRGKTCPVVESGIPLIATNCIKNDHLYPTYEKIRYVSKETYDTWFRGHPESGDMIFVCKGSPGRVSWVLDPIEFCIAQDMVAIRADETKVYPKYLFALLRSEATQKQIENMHVGTLIPHFKKTDFGKLFLQIPEDYEYQKMVGDNYFKFCEKIALNRQMNQTLESMAQTIFKSWFVDFEPVKAKIAALESGEDAEGVTRAAMRAISGKTDDELDKMEGGQPEDYAQLKTTAELFPAAMQDSELGELPEGWGVKKVSHFVELAYGKALKKTIRVKGEIPVYGSGGVNGTHNISLVEGPGVIVGRKGTVGSLYWEDNSFYPIDTVFYIKPIGEISLEFAYYLFQTLGLEYMNTDAAVPGLNRENVYRLEVPGFDEELLACFTDTVKSVRKIIASLLSEIYVLKKIRDTLLPILLSGELSVDAIELEEVN